VRGAFTVALAAGFSAAGVAHAQKMYRVTEVDLPDGFRTGVVAGVNNDGQIASDFSVFDADSNTTFGPSGYLFLPEPDYGLDAGLTSVGFLNQSAETRRHAKPWGMNNEGVVVGISETADTLPGGFNKAYRGFRSVPGEPIEDLGAIGGDASDANDVNDLGEVAGWAEDDDTFDEAIIDFGTGLPTGDTVETRKREAVVWRADGSVEVLPSLGGEWHEAVDINNDGAVLGRGRPAPDDPTLALLELNQSWLYLESPMYGLPAGLNNLQQMLIDEGFDIEQSFGGDINNNGEAIFDVQNVRPDANGNPTVFPDTGVFLPEAAYGLDAGVSVIRAFNEYWPSGLRFISDNGHMAGSAREPGTFFSFPVTWERGEWSRVNPFLVQDKPEDWFVTSVNGINDQSEMVGIAFLGSDNTYRLVTLTPIAMDCPADADRDRTGVDLNDLLAVLGSFGQGVKSWENGDTDGNARVDLDDLLNVLANFGNSCVSIPG
jgi:hypothetical protein